jgi:nicotinate-nucleotide adenylyltransferase
LIKVALYGGSFDPPHLGHQEAIKVALASLKIDRIIVVPTYLSPFKKQSLATAKQRMDWCGRLFGELTHVEVSDFEVTRGRTVYTVETLAYFQQSYEVTHLVIGADQLASLKAWHAFEQINQAITWAIIKREGYGVDTTLLHRHTILPMSIQVSSTEIRTQGRLDEVDPRIRPEVRTLLKQQGVL